ncbi:MAG: amidohydrolase, partial [Burkholderiales bacterium PBB5]
MDKPIPGSAAWLDLAREAPIDPERPIIDPHHHLWFALGARPAYLLADLWADTGAGHNIVKTVFVECRAAAREDGPEHLKPVGETEFVAPGRGAEGLYADADFRAGVALLGELGLTYDTWHYHHQNAAFADLARAVPGTTMVLDHFGTPLGVGPYAGQREAIFSQWQRDIVAIARCPNVVAKLGGLAMPDNGFGWNQRDRPASSDELLEAQARYYHHAIACFGPERCLF